MGASVGEDVGVSVIDSLGDDVVTFDEAGVGNGVGEGDGGFVGRDDGLSVDILTLSSRS